MPYRVFNAFAKAITVYIYIELYPVSHLSNDIALAILKGKLQMYKNAMICN